MCEGIENVNRKVLITGGSGYLAWELVRRLKAQGKHSVAVASSDPLKLSKDSNYNGVECVSNERIWDDDAWMQGVDVVIHTAFCRKSLGDQLMQSLAFSQKLFQRVAEMGTPALINASSQSVFGSSKNTVPLDDDSYAPGYMYALAKSSSELLLESILEKTNVKYTSVRLASLVGPSKHVPINIIYKFVESALSGDDIYIQGGKQEFSFLDVRDAAEAIIRIVDLSLNQWYKHLNLGPENRINILELAKESVSYAAKKTGKVVQIHLTEDDTVLYAGMNSTRLFDALNWKPRFSIADTISATGKYIIQRNEENA